MESDETKEDTQSNCDIDPDVTGATSSTSKDLPDDLDELSKASEPVDTSTIHTRDQDHTYSQQQKNNRRRRSN